MVEAAVLERFLQGFDTRGDGAVTLTDGHACHGSRVLDQARLPNHRGDMGNAAGNMRRPQAFRQHVHAADSVLERDDQGIGAQKRLALVGAGFRIPQLDCEQDRIDRADFGRVVGHGNVLQVKVALVA